MPAQHNSLSLSAPQLAGPQLADPLGSGPDGFDLSWIGSRTGSAERRQVVILAVGFSPIAAADPEEISEALERRRHFVARIASRYGGMVDRADPELQLLYWGWPVAHEADARLAVAAALEISAESGDGARCGVDAGIAVTAEAGAARSGSGLVGEMLRTAVAQKAVAEPGQVVVSETVRLLVSGVFTLAALPGPDLGSRLWTVERSPPLLAPVSVPAYAMVKRGHDLVGRTAEVAALEDRWRDVCRGGMRSLLIEGEAGIGKSALVHRLEQLVGDAGGQFVSIACLPEHQNRSLEPIGNLARALESQLPADGDASGESQVKTSAAGALAAGAWQLLAAIAVRQARVRPLLIVIEDLQWADRDSLVELARFRDGITDVGGLMLILTSRPRAGEVSPFHQLASGVLEIGSLPQPEIDRIVGQSEFASRLSQQSRRLVCEHAEGNAFYAIELARLCAETPDRNAHHRLLSGPNKLNAALTGKLDALATLKPLVQAAAVLGRVFDGRVLAALLEIDERVLAERLGMLVSLGILSQRGGAHGQSYRFKHALLWSQAYGSVLKARRRELHLKIARDLVHRFERNAGIELEVIAFHWKKAGRPHEAFNWWSQAARGAAKRGEDAVAIDFIHDALAAKQSAPEACTPLEEAELMGLLARQQQALRGSASREAVSAYECAMELLAGAKDRSTDLDLNLAWGLASIHLVRGDIKAAMASSSKLLQDARERGRDDLEVLALRIHGTANLLSGRISEAIELLSSAVELFDPGLQRQRNRLYISDPAASSLAHLASAQAAAGDKEGARLSRRRALERAAQVGDAHTSSNILGVLALGAIHLGEVGVAAALARASEEVASQHGYTYWAARAALIQAWAAARRMPAHGLEGIQRALEAYRSTGAGRASVVAHCLAAEVAISARQPRQALSMLTPFKNKGYLQGEWLYMPELMRLEALALHQIDADQVMEVDSLLVEACSMAADQGCRAFQERIVATRAAVVTGRGSAAAGGRGRAGRISAKLA